MKAIPLLFRATFIVIFLELMLGGLLTFDFISPASHIILGFIVFVLAIATLLLSMVSKPSFKPMQTLSLVILVLILVQIVLGFATLDTGNQVVAWAHFANAMVIFGAAITGNFVALRWGQIEKARSVREAALDQYGQRSGSGQ